MAQLDRIPEFFYNNFLSKPATAIPKGSQWIAMFDDIPQAAIRAAAEAEPRAWQIDEAMELVTGTADWMNRRACLFFQGIELPEESQIANPVGIQLNGYLRTRVGAGRNDSLELRAAIIDTNVSFAQNVIRPWVLATGHFGMIARNDEYRYRTNLTVFKLGSLVRAERPFIRETIQFFDVCPVSVSGQELNYTSDSSPSISQVAFNFNYYKIDSESGNQFLNPPDDL